MDVLYHWMKLKVCSRLSASFLLEESECLSWWLYWRRKTFSLPYLSGRRMDKCGGKVHCFALIRDNHIPYFQAIPHLIADVSRYWLSVFWKPVTEPCREFTEPGGCSETDRQSENMGWAWLCLSHIPRNASRVLGASVKLRVYYIFGPLWCLSLCYHKTALPLCFNPSGLSDILKIYHLLFFFIFIPSTLKALLPLCLPLFFLERS